jgi:hypothetical protein
MLYRKGKTFYVIDNSGVSRGTSNLKHALNMESIVNVVGNINDKHNEELMKEVRELKRDNKKLYETKRLNGERGTGYDG